VTETSETQKGNNVAADFSHSEHRYIFFAYLNV